MPGWRKSSSYAIFLFLFLLDRNVRKKNPESVTRSNREEVWKMS